MEAIKRAETLSDSYGGWTLSIIDDQEPLPEKDLPMERRVTIVKDSTGEVLVEFFYPSYRVYTLLAHWKDEMQ